MSAAETNARISLTKDGADPTIKTRKVKEDDMRKTGRNQAWKNFVQFERYGEKLSGMLIHRENKEDGRGENTGRRRKRVRNEQ